MGHIAKFEDFINESLSQGAKPSKKMIDDLVKLAKDKSESFIEEFAQVYGSAAEIWMDEKDVEKLMGLYASGQYDFVCLGGESRAGDDDTKMEQMSAKGWRLLADEQNEESYDSVLYKKKK